MSAIDELIEDTGAFDCVECGKCTSVCPVAEINSEFAPRLIVVKAQAGLEGLAKEKDIWSCLTCGLCNDMCPYKVDFTEFIRGMRSEAVIHGALPVCSKGGLLQTMGRIMTSPELKQNRLSWVTDDLKVAEKGDIYFFTGCTAHFDYIFEEREIKTSGILVAAVKIMNSAGITPAVSNDEVCCGHDLNWTGNEEHFEKLMEKNLEVIKASGAKQVVFTCPEGMRTFEFDYKDIAGDLGFEVLHISELILDLIDQDKLQHKDLDGKVTFHDPCRLGRHLGIYDDPRDMIKETGAELVEMERSRNKSTCCGVSAFATCEASSKQMQIERLKEAKKTGAQKMLTFCPKCWLHFKCSTWKKFPGLEEEVDIPIEDATIFFSKTLE
ncbi:MAG: 4Fe-4S dicluster domain-containing protein [Thermoplasmata archaeon]|nr:MAG: 4Fe-4S dicluster domain-containing protein [Thermoplasmata archaeon]